uniref:Uncharacterized protein n=1 Tax=Schizaphis graminum TaxID=13262 RepID=A0A2S2NJM6_SCHGA
MLKNNFHFGVSYNRSVHPCGRSSILLSWRNHVWNRSLLAMDFSSQGSNKDTKKEKGNTFPKIEKILFIATISMTLTKNIDFFLDITIEKKKKKRRKRKKLNVNVNMTINKGNTFPNSGKIFFIVTMSMSIKISIDFFLGKYIYIQLYKLIIIKLLS